MAIIATTRSYIKFGISQRSSVVYKCPSLLLQSRHQQIAFINKQPSSTAFQPHSEYLLANKQLSSLIPNIFSPSLPNFKMHSISKAIVPATALLAMVQYCPAPFLPAVAVAVAVSAGSISIDAGSIAGVVGAAGGVAGAVEGGIQAHHSRDIESKPHQFMSRIKHQDLSSLGLGTAWPDCHSQLGSANLNFSSPSTSSK